MRAGRSAAAALLAALLHIAAHAQDPANGALIYKTPQEPGKRSCANSACHGTLPAGAQNRIVGGKDAARIKAATGAESQMAFLANKLSNEQLNDLAAYIALTLGGSPIYLPVAATPRPLLDPASINFGVQALAIATPAQTVTLSNAASATAPLVLGTLALTTGSDFALAGGTCAAGQSLAAGASCTVAVTFRPTLAGTRSGSLTITHNAGSSVLGLIGLGGSEAPVVSLSPSQLTFSQALGGTSGTQRVVLSNIGDARLVFDGVALSGSSAAEYSIDAGSTCSTGVSVAAGANCSVDIRFTPAAAGSREAALVLRHNAGSGSSTVALVGQASNAAAPTMTLDAALVDLGTQAVGLAGTARTLTVGNSGAANLVISALTLRGLHSADIVMAGSCQVGTPVPPGASCTVTLALKPAAVGTRSATLELASNTPTGTASVTLQGEGVALPSPIVALSRPALGYGRVTLATTTAARTVTLSNAGSAELALGEIQSSSTEFAVTHDCPASLAAGARCTLGVAYQPAAAANAAERVLIRSNAFSSPNSIVLTGLGVSSVLPVLAWTEAAEADFGSVAVGQSSTTLTYTLNNQGPGEVAVSSFVLTGSAPEAYSIAGGTCSGGIRLAQGANCTVLLQFVPEVAGARRATLLVASDGTNPADVLLSGIGSASTTPTPTPTPGPTPNPTPTPTPGTPSTSPFATDRAMLDFRATVVRTGGRSDPLSLRITNRSTAAATLRSATTSSGFVLEDSSATDACRGVPWTLPPGTSCSLSVSFAPSVGGAGSGTLTLTAEDGSVLTVAMAAEARTEISNVGGGGGAFALHWLLLLAAAVALLARCPAPPHIRQGNSK